MSDDRMQEAVVHWFRQLPEELFADKTLVRIPVVISFNTTTPSGFSFTCLMYGGRAGKETKGINGQCEMAMCCGQGHCWNTKENKT